MNTSASPVRCLAVWLTVTVSVAGLVLWMGHDLGTTQWSEADFDALLGLVAEVALCLCAGWFWVVTTVVTAQARHGATAGSALDPVLCPPALRRLLLTACGIALTSSLASAPALASSGPPTAESQQTERHHLSAPSSLVGLSLPDRVTAPETAPTPARAARVVTVRPGDTLWSLTADLLPPGASDAEIAVGWQAIHEHNRRVIGGDPDLILPGTQLSIPDLAAVAR
ncbi:hypothetical protein NOCA290082 [metagenome]|uniref:Uncharacterized protein n=1 Tax=metagenome TaxID=256318 RepID=A0A2P2CG44_9ZZZZ